MDRIISLLAALVGLIALGGAILVHVNGDVQRKELATEIAELKASMSPAPNGPSSAPAVAASAPAPSGQSLAPSSEAPPDPQAAQIERLQTRIAELEQQNHDQASQLAAAQERLVSAQPASMPSIPETSAPLSAVASSASIPVLAPLARSASSEIGQAPSSSSASSPASSAPASGPNADCIPVGTRFVGKPTDSFAICKTPVTVKIVAVSDGVATIEGAGPIAAGSFGELAGKGCSVMVFSADISGFADLRVSCP